MYLGRFQIVLLIGVLGAAAASATQNSSGPNLALIARASASSSAEGSTAEYLNDGDTAHTEWVAKDGSIPADSWAQLDWTEPIQCQEIVIRQDGDPKLTHFNLEIRDSSGHWELLKSIGDSEHLLPRLVLAQFNTHSTTGLRLSSFVGHIGINEIEVYDRMDPPVIVLGSDLLNHIFGVVTDGFGTLPFGNVSVSLQGTVEGKPWGAIANTDKNGIFLMDLPVGLEGEVSASALIADKVAKTTVSAGDFSPGLSAIDTQSPEINLDGDWRFEPDPNSGFSQVGTSDSDWKKIAVPSHWAMQGFDSQTGTGGYRRHFQLPSSFEGRRIKLLFEGVYSGAEVWVNGHRIGYHEGGFAPFELDITNAVNVGGDNLLAVLVREDTLSSHLDDMSHYADFPLAGIFRPVHLFSSPVLHVRRFHVQTTFDSTYKNATLAVDLSVENESMRDYSDASLIFTLEDPDGRAVPLDSDHINLSLPSWSRVEKQLQFAIRDPEHWEAEHPRLYTLTARLVARPNSQSVSRRVGFRQVDIHGSQFLINGVPVKLRGIGYYEATPLTGRVVTPDLLRHDLEMLKDANLDALRTEVMMPRDNLYDDADEMGFYVEAESPFCWVDESSDLRYLPIFVQRTAEVLDRNRSHPSLIIWSIGNESSWGPDFEAAHQFVKDHDTTRPTSAGQSASLELDTMHNPISLARMKERENEPVPIIWDESFCIFQGRLWGDTRETWLDPGDRDYYISPLIDIWDAVQASKNVQGSMIWAWVDDIFLVPGRDSEYGRGGIGRPDHPLDGIYHMPGRGIVGDAPWGLIDGWRRKKPEFWHIKMLMSPIHFQQRNLPDWHSGQPALLRVDNRYEFTDLSELTLDWSLGPQHGTLRPEIAPHTSGQIAIPIPEGTKPGSVLEVQFKDSRGHLIIPQRMQLGASAGPANNSLVRRGSLRYVHEGSWLSGPLERFIGDHFEIAFDGNSGRIRRALVNGQSVLYETPKLHVQPIEGTLVEFPMYETWRLTKSLEIHPAKENYEVIEEGAYRDFVGKLHFFLSPDGGIRVTYEFTYTGTDVRAREVGLQFGVPLWCDKLQWHRAGEWTVYPDDHIGRNNGVAMAHAPGPQTVPPSQTYALDDSPIGTNDFRSTKRNFIFASLLDKDGYGIGMEAVGTQHLRASVGVDAIEVNVNDWFGGVAATAWGEWWQNYGQGREIRPDDPNEGVAHNKLSGSVKLYLLGPADSVAWLARTQALSSNAN